MDFKITLSNIKLDAKPTGKQVGSIKNSMTHIKEINLDVLKSAVLNYSFTPAVLEGGISAKNWKSQQVFVLDFDGGITPEEFLNKVKEYEMDEPNIIYSSFSDTPELRKFRVIWVLDEVITDFDFASVVREGLMKLYPECDKSCKNADRMFYPGKSILHFNTDICFINFFTSQCESAMIKANANNRKKCGKNRQSYSNTIEQAEISTNLRHFDFDSAIKEIQILDAFFNGQYHLKYNELFGLATNLQFIEGGLKKMKERMIEINNMGGGYDTTDNDGKLYKYNHHSVLTIVKYNYAPMQLQNFSPFESDHKYLNILDLVNFRKGKVEIINPINLIDLSEAEKLMQDKFNEVINKVSNGSYPLDCLFEANTCVTSLKDTGNIYIFKLSTGIGKTKLLETLKDYLIALPTNDLKEEVSLRMKLPHYVTPSYPEFSIEDINSKLRTLHNCGLYEIASKIIKDIANNRLKIEKVKIQLTEEDILMAKNFIKLNTECRNTNETVLTTHTRAIFDKNFKHDTIVFDEDPLQYLIEIGETTLDFSKFDGTKWKTTIEPIEDYYRNKLGENYVDDSKSFNTGGTEFNEFCAEIKRGDIIKLLDSKYVYKDTADKGNIKYCIVNELPKNKNIIIMSATVPVNLYKQLYGDRVKVIDISNIKHMGVINQYTKRSFSQGGMKDYSPKIYEEVLDIIKGDPVITHLKHQEKFKNNKSKYYFGNCAGGDTLKGVDIAVIGTPNKPMFVYFFYSMIVGYKPIGRDNNMFNQVVEWNGMRFKFFTFENEILRDIQFSLIESELLQAAGRNRTLRTNAKTNIFSSLPLTITQNFIEK